MIKIYCKLFIFGGDCHPSNTQKQDICEDDMFIQTHVINSRTKLFSFSHRNTQHTANITDNLIKFLNFILLLIHFF